MARHRAGVTLMELLVVLFVIGIVTAIGLPRFASMRAQANVNAAKDQVAASLVTARAAAIRHGLPAEFHFTAGEMWVTVTDPANGAQVLMGSKTAVTENLAVTVAPTPNAETIRYDGRGFATLAGGNGKIRFTQGVRTDSLCVTRLGVLMKGGCL
jgi:prepilin-type N-terminal cleavage/methylation domain-containing protein